MEMRIYSVLGVPAGFRMKASYDEKNIIKAAGFQWDPGQKCWYTRDFRVASSMAGMADEEAARFLKVGSFPILTGRPPGMCEEAWAARQAAGRERQ